MNSLGLTKVLRWGIGILSFVVASTIVGVVTIRADTENNREYEFRSFDTEKLSGNVPGDHDGVGGLKELRQIQLGVSASHVRNLADPREDDLFVNQPHHHDWLMTLILKRNILMYLR